ncbi:MAG: hypothetical protein AAGA20_15805 [Planctomycetota bacterium]
MRRSLLILALLAPFPSCTTMSLSAAGSPSGPATSLAETPSSGPVEGRPTWGPPLALPGTSTRIIPFARETSIGWFGDKDRFAEGGARTYAVGGDAPSDKLVRTTASGTLRWHNGVAHDVDTDEQWPLLDRRGIVSRYWMRVDRSSFGARSTALVFAVTDEDTNGDGMLDDRDAVRALATDGDGRAPRYISPAGTQLRSLVFDDDRDLVVLMIASDLDGDGKFRAEETAEPYAFDLTSGGDAIPLIRPSTRAVLDAALDR